MDDVLKHLVSTKDCSFERSFRAKNCLISLFRALELLNIVAERIKMNKSKDKENPLQDSLAHQFVYFGTNTSGKPFRIASTGWILNIIYYGVRRWESTVSKF